MQNVREGSVADMRYNKCQFIPHKKRGGGIMSLVLIALVRQLVLDRLAEQNFSQQGVRELLCDWSEMQMLKCFFADAVVCTAIDRL